MKIWNKSTLGRVANMRRICMIKGKVGDSNVLQQKEGSSEYCERGTVWVVAVPGRRKREERRSNEASRGEVEQVLGEKTGLHIC